MTQDTKTQIEISESDLGLWFGVDGKAIKNQEQLDLAIIALAGLYGKRFGSLLQMQNIHRFVHLDDAEIDEDLFTFLSFSADRAFQYLNTLLPEGYEFNFEGAEYQNFILEKSK